MVTRGFKLKIGLFLCDCGRNISGVIDNNRLIDHFSNYPEIHVIGDQYLCSELGLNKIIEEINDGNLFLRKISKDDIEFVFQSLNDKNLITFLSLGPLKTLEHSKGLIKNYFNLFSLVYL